MTRNKPLVDSGFVIHFAWLVDLLFLVRLLPMVLLFALAHYCKVDYLISVMRWENLVALPRLTHLRTLAYLRLMVR